MSGEYWQQIQAHIAATEQAKLEKRREQEETTQIRREEALSRGISRIEEEKVRIEKERARILEFLNPAAELVRKILLDIEAHSPEIQRSKRHVLFVDRTGIQSTADPEVRMQLRWGNVVTGLTPQQEERFKDSDRYAQYRPQGLSQLLTTEFDCYSIGTSLNKYGISLETGIPPYSLSKGHFNMEDFLNDHEIIFPTIISILKDPSHTKRLWYRRLRKLKPSHEYPGIHQMPNGPGPGL